jgi:CRP/FNR family transcriptional regulator
MVSPATCQHCSVRDTAVCSALPEAGLAVLAARGQQRRIERGATLAKAGEPWPLCASVQRGLLKISHLGAGGHEAIVGLAWPGDFIGLPFAGQNIAAHDVVALSGVTLCVFPQAVMERTLADHPEMAQLLLARTLTELAAARGRVAVLARASALARVAGFLVETARRDPAARNCEGVAAIELPLRRGEMADLLGLTIETVSRQVRSLERAGVIGLPGGRAVLIQDPDALAEAAEDLV